MLLSLQEFRNSLSRRASRLRQVWEDDFKEGDPWETAEATGIHISSNKEFYTGWIAEGKFVAALFIGYNHECFGFDITVLPEWQRKGLGSKLLEDAIDHYDDIQEAYPGMAFCVDAVNPHMVRMLQRKGFVITGKEREDTRL